LLAYLLEKHAPRYADAVAFAATSTLRRSEICRILWADVDGKNHVILVHDRKHPRRKRGNDERVLLTDAAWAILQKQPRDDTRVFPIHPQTLSKYVNDACKALTIPADVSRVQIDAADPDVSAFVSANAGSGKTHVLVQRVIRLLLDGVPPQKILCITFTKAAAANMATSVFDRLAQWTALADDELDVAIHSMSNEWPQPERRARARRLFAQALEAPGGLPSGGGVGLLRGDIFLFQVEQRMDKRNGFVAVDQVP